MSLPANPVPALSRRVGELEDRVAELEKIIGARTSETTEPECICRLDRSHRYDPKCPVHRAWDVTPDD